MKYWLRVGKEANRPSKTQKRIKIGHKNKLQTATDTVQAHCVTSVGSLRRKESTHEKCDGIIVPADSCVVVCVN